MSLRHISCVATILGLVGGAASGQHIVPSALLTIDQNRATVVERIVNQWGDPLAQSNAGISAAQLREILSGLRSDHLLAASLAGSVEGLRDVVSGALVRTDAAVSPTLMHAKSLGDTTDDLVYTPVVPCRIVDTRQTGSGAFQPSTQRDWVAYSPGGFAAQGGSATNCGIPVRPVAVMFNPTLANTVGGPEFVTFWPSGQTRPLAASVNWWASAQQPANAQIVPLCTGGGCTADFSAYASGQTNVIIDVVGYFNRPTNYVGTHVITGVGATDSGGTGNTASGPNSTVAGGAGNVASGDGSFVAGGSGNRASGALSFVLGQFNTASGNYSTVAGGFDNMASGAFSFAAGYRAKTQTAGGSVHDGTFVFADLSNSTPFAFRTIAPNEFAVRATGGVRFVTAIDGSGNPARTVAIDGTGNLSFGNTTRQMLNLYNAEYGIGVQDFTAYSRSFINFAWFHGGSHASPAFDPGVGGELLMTLTPAANPTTSAVNGIARAQTFTSTSDRAAKTAFVPVDVRLVLDQLARMPIATWSYKNEGSIRHIGPVAQDFSTAFGVGYDDKTITTIDADGVALAAIQGLHQMMRQKDVKLRKQSEDISALKRKLLAIEAKLGI